MGISTGESATASDVRKLATLTQVNDYTRLMTAASGNVAYTNFTFTPKALTFFANEPILDIYSYGMYASAQNCLRFTTSAANAVPQGALVGGRVISLFTGTAGQTASVQSVASTGFTLHWEYTATYGGGAVSAGFTVLAIGDGL